MQVLYIQHKKQWHAVVWMVHSELPSFRERCISGVLHTVREGFHVNVEQGFMSVWWRVSCLCGAGFHIHVDVETQMG